MRIKCIWTLTCFFVLAAAQEVKHNMPVYMHNMVQEMSYSLDPNNFKSTKKWKEKARKEILAAAGPTLPDTALTYHITDTQQRQGYTVHKITYTLSKWNQGKAYLLIPDSCKNAPGLLMLHDHGAHFSIGKEKLVKPFNVDTNTHNDALTWVRKCYDNTFLADEYAQKGYVVLVADALLWGERQSEGGTKYDQQQAIAAGMMQMGYSLGGMMLHDDLRTLQLLCSLPCVNPDRVGCLGFSMGAYRAWMLTAVTDKIKATAAICWMTTMQDQLTPPKKPKGGSDYSMFIYGLAKKLDFPHIAALASPRPLLLFNGTNDKLFPIRGVQQAYNTIQGVYEREKALDYLTLKLLEEKHFFNKKQQEETQAFFQKFL